jgi:hypothetical protein
MAASEHDDDDWYIEANTLIEDLERLRVEHESRRWNEANVQNQIASGAFKSPTRAAPRQRSNIVKHLATQPTLEDSPALEALKNIQFDLNMDQKANKTEEAFGPELTEEDLARHFGQTREKKKKGEPKGLNKMTLAEIEAWEAKQDNATDIYKIKARVANLARGANASLTPQGEILCNSYVHVMKAFYDFAEKIEDPDTKIGLISLIRNQEGMPGTSIAAAGAGVKMK